MNLETRRATTLAAEATARAMLVILSVLFRLLTGAWQAVRVTFLVAAQESVRVQAHNIGIQGTVLRPCFRVQDFKTHASTFAFSS